MRHLLAAVGLIGATLVAGAILDALARTSPGPGIMLAWDSKPGRWLAWPAAADVRIVNTWAAGHLVQMHVGVMRDLGSLPPTTWLAVRLPTVAVTMAGCG